VKFIRVNISTETVRTVDVPKEYAGLGGRGLTSVNTKLYDPLPSTETK
jgi:hypothetical protein